MRVSTAQVYVIANQGISQAQQGVNKTNEQMSSGKKLLSPADDPVAAATILQLQQELARTEQYGRNINMAQNSLELETSTIETVGKLVQRMREIATAAGNTATLTAANYSAYAAEVETRIGELLNLQNTRNASGQYIFAGYQSDTAPFVSDTNGNYVYQGDEGQLVLNASAAISVPVSDSGKKLFVDIPSGHNTFNTSANPLNSSQPPAVISLGEVVDQEAFDKLYPEDLVISFRNNAGTLEYAIHERNSGRQLQANQPYTPGQTIAVAGAEFSVRGTPADGDSFFVESTDKQSLLTTLSRLAQAMRNVDDTPASKQQLADLVGKSLNNLINVTDKLAVAEGDLGARLNTLESAKNLNLDVTLTSKTLLSRLESLDYAEASIQLTMQSLTLNAAQQSFVKVSQLSLFNYL